MDEQFVILLTYFVLAAFVGFEVISKVPTILHTPLMSGTNAIHGIILVGAIVIAAPATQASTSTPVPRNSAHSPSANTAPNALVAA